jgi:hypothetical protein
MFDISGWPLWRIKRIWDGLLLAWIVLAGAFYVTKFRSDILAFFHASLTVRHSDHLRNGLLRRTTPKMILVRLSKTDKNENEGSRLIWIATKAVPG